MRDTLDELTKEDLNRKYIIRQINITYFNQERRTRLFKELNECENKIKKLKFKLNFERKIYENNNTNSTKN